MNKHWPEENKTVSFEDLVEPVDIAIRDIYTLRFKSYRDINWTGYDVGEDTKACSFSPDEALTGEMLKYDCQEQGRSPLHVIVGIAVQLGIEQGRRLEKESIKTYIKMLKLSARGLE